MRTTVVSVVIANGQSLSGGVDLGGDALVEIVMPSAWTAADLTFQTSDDEVTFQNMYSGGGEVQVSVDASQNVRLDPSDFIGINFLKVRSGTSGTPVNQGAERTIKLVLLGEVG
jgi:hypothetical protein